MNAAELAANPQADATRRARPQRRSRACRSPTTSFDAVVCCVSVDYLVRPVEVFRRRRPGAAAGRAVRVHVLEPVLPDQGDPRVAAWRPTSEHCEIVAEYFRRAGGWEEPIDRAPHPRRPLRRSALGRVGAPSVDSPSHEGFPARPPRGRDRRRRLASWCGSAARVRCRRPPAAGGASCRVPTSGEPVCVSTVLVAGLGEVGVRTARQLIDTPGVDRVIVAARRAGARPRGRRRAARRRRAAARSGATTRCRPMSTRSRRRFPATSTPRSRAAAVAAGIPYASCADRDSAIRALLALDDRRPRPRRARASRAAGSRPASPTSSPGTRRARSTRSTSCTSRAGVSRVRSRRAKRGGRNATTRRSGATARWSHDKHRHAQLIWFPDPVGARECELVATGVELLVAATPGVGRVTSASGIPPTRRLRPAGSARPGRGMGRGAGRGVGLARSGAHVGRLRRHRAHRDRRRHRARRHRRLAGRRAARPRARRRARCLRGSGAVVDPVAFLAELARRGVKAAAFEGVAVA